MRKIIVVYKSDNNDMGEALQALEKATKDYSPEFIPREKLLEKDTRDALVIVAGGDGTFLGASHRILDNYSIVLGVRLRQTSKGFYDSVDIEKLEEALEVISNEKKKKGYNIERLDRLECVMHTDSGNWVRTDLALNEYFIANTCAYFPSKYTIIKQDENGKREKEWQRSSGVLACTSHGYSGWVQWASGGIIPVFLGKRFLVYVREPIGKIKMEQLWIDENERFFIKSDMFRGYVVPDSFDEYHFNRGAEIEIRLSDKPLNIIRMKYPIKWKRK